MDWLWGKKEPNKDPTKSLDKDLKQFLDEQTPKPYAPAQPTPVAPKDNSLQSSSVAPGIPSPEQQVPKESLFQDGRYKDLWKTYVPQHQLEAVNSNPAQQLVDAKKERKASLHAAALENCAFEEELKRNCFNVGDTANRIRARMTMCNQETKAFHRCFQLQAKFLQALGYQSDVDSAPEDDERIQMHADKLYHRMMDYEAAVDQAKAKGEPIPPLTSVFNPTRPAPTVEDIRLPRHMEDGLKKPLRDLPPHERELAARAVLSEAKLSQTRADDFYAYTTTLNEARQDRQKKLVAAFGETLGKFFIPDAPAQHELKKQDNQDFDRDFWKDDIPRSKS